MYTATIHCFNNNRSESYTTIYVSAMLQTINSQVNRWNHVTCMQLGIPMLGT